MAALILNDVELYTDEKARQAGEPGMLMPIRVAWLQRCSILTVTWIPSG